VGMGQARSVPEPARFLWQGLLPHIGSIKTAAHTES